MSKEERKHINEITFLNLRSLSICIAIMCQFKIYETKTPGRATLTNRSITNHDQVMEWPFLTALYRTDHSKFFCGGTLISSRHILTAAHCVHEKYSQERIQPDYITVLFGAYNLTTKIEVGARQIEVDEIYVHPDWKVYSESYDADIAILLLSESVTFTKHIGPVTMPNGDVIIDGASGSIVGWEVDDTEIDNETLAYAVKPVRTLYCPKDHPLLPFFSSTHTFCGRSEDETANKVISGGGFFIRSGTTWMQYGIILAIPSNESSHIDTNAVSFYTNVQEYSKWITTTVRKAGVSVMKMDELSEVKINFDCVYMDRPGGSEAYECWLFDMEVRSENVEVTSVTGVHLNNSINADVDGIRFINGTMFYIPDGIGRIFKNVQGIIVGSENQSSLMSTKIIKRSNFKHLRYLYKIFFYPNDIASLDEDTFWDLPYLEEFFVIGNKLKVIPERLFEKNAKLLNVDLRSNQLEYLPKNLFRNNLLLKRVDFHDNSLKLIEIDFTGFTFIKEIWLYDNICVSIFYDVRNETSGRYAQFTNRYSNLTEFQNSINANCDSQVEKKKSRFILFIISPKRIYVLAAIFCSVIASVVVAIRKKSQILKCCKNS